MSCMASCPLRLWYSLPSSSSCSRFQISSEDSVSQLSLSLGSLDPTHIRYLPLILLVVGYITRSPDLFPACLLTSPPQEARDSQYIIQLYSDHILPLSKPYPPSATDSRKNGATRPLRSATCSTSTITVIGALSSAAVHTTTTQPGLVSYKWLPSAYITRLNV